jgi:hypothetical protein
MRVKRGFLLLKELSMVDLTLFRFMYVTYLLFNLGAVFPGGSEYFAPEKRFHINSKGKSSWGDMSSSKE